MCDYPHYLDCFALTIRFEESLRFRHHPRHRHCPNVRIYFPLARAAAAAAVAAVAAAVDDCNYVSDQPDFDNLDSDSDESAAHCYSYGFEKRATRDRFDNRPLFLDYFYLDSSLPRLTHRFRTSGKRNADLDNCDSRCDFVFAHRWARLPARSPISRHPGPCSVLSHAQRIVDLTSSSLGPSVCR